jgi:pimeloyl-ACP methyl ester carboxylesterase
MIEDARGNIDYDEAGSGPTIVLVPGSCSTGAAWRPVIAAWEGRFRAVTTSLLGYGGTAERRTRDDPAIAHEIDIVEAVVRQTGDDVHLVGHSFGALVSLAAALRRNVRLASLTILEAPAAEMLRDRGETDHHGAFRRMTDGYFARFARGEPDAIADMIDFYGGVGTFASWPPRLRAYANETTAVNILDWASAGGFPLRAEELGSLALPALIVHGGISHPAAQRANRLLAECIKGASAASVEGAAHFMIATHAGETAGLIAEHVARTS